MAEASRLPSFPDRGQVESKLVQLIEGKISRTEAELWADKLAAEHEESRVRVTDWPAWEALQNLKAADLKNAPDEYFHDESEFGDWLKELRAAPKPS